MANRRAEPLRKHSMQRATAEGSDVAVEDRSSLDPEGGGPRHIVAAGQQGSRVESIEAAHHEAQRDSGGVVDPLRVVDRDQHWTGPAPLLELTVVGLPAGVAPGSSPAGPVKVTTGPSDDGRDGAGDKTHVGGRGVGRAPPEHHLEGRTPGRGEALELRLQDGCQQVVEHDEGKAPFLLRGDRLQHQVPGAFGCGQCGPPQPRLAHAGSALEECDAGPLTGEEAPERLELVYPTDQRWLDLLRWRSTTG